MHVQLHSLQSVRHTSIAGLDDLGSNHVSVEPVGDLPVQNRDIKTLAPAGGVRPITGGLYIMTCSIGTINVCRGKQRLVLLPLRNHAGGAAQQSLHDPAHCASPGGICCAYSFLVLIHILNRPRRVLGDPGYVWMPLLEDVEPGPS